MHSLLHSMQWLFIIAALASVAAFLYCLIYDPVLPISLRRLLARRHFFALPRWGRVFAGRGGMALANSLYRFSAPALGLERERKEGDAYSWPGSIERQLGRIAKAGRLAGRLSEKVLAFIAWSHFVFIATTCLLVFCYKWIDPPMTVLMAYRRFENHYKIAGPEPVRIPEDISKRRREMLKKVEDGNFDQHHGFDFAAINYALKINKRNDRIITGASTLSMQTARTLFLIPVKNYFRKYLEAIVTVEIEAILGKERILELYFSTAEWGRGVFGIQAASRRYFGRPVGGISDESYIRLLSLLPSPQRYNPETLFNNRSLAWRYDYLVNRYLAPPAEQTAPANGGPDTAQDEAPISPEGEAAPSEAAPSSDEAPTAP